MNTPVLEVRELSKRFGGINATDRVGWACTKVKFSP